MKIFNIVAVLFLTAILASFTNPASEIAFLPDSPVSDCDSVPLLNQQVVEYTKQSIGKKIGRGECWDLAAGALNSIGAKWDGNYVYGKKLDVKTDCIYPGDIIQFERVKLKYEKDGLNYVEEMSHHTAVVYEVKAKGSFVLAHQNTRFSGRKVGLSPINLEDITKGKFKIYRPVK